MVVVGERRALIISRTAKPNRRVILWGAVCAKTSKYVILNICQPIFTYVG